MIDHDSTARRSWPQPIVLAGLVLAVACLYWARFVFIPIALAMLFAFLLSPAVALVRRTRLPQVASVLVVVLLACLLAGGLGWALFTQFSALADDLPRYRATLIAKIAQIQKVSDSPAIAVLGAGAALANPGAFIPIALKDISELDPTRAEYVANWVFFSVVSLLPLAVAMVLLLVAREWAERLLVAVRGWLERNARTVAAVIVVLLAASLIRNGIAGLTG